MRSIPTNLSRISMLVSFTMAFSLLTGCGGGESKKAEESTAPKTSIAGLAAAYEDRTNEKMGVINSKGQEILQASDAGLPKLTSEALLYFTIDRATAKITAHFLTKDLKNIVAPIQDTKLGKEQISNAFIGYEDASGNTHIHSLAGTPVLDGEKVQDYKISDQLAAYITSTDEVIVKDTQGNQLFSYTARSAALGGAELQVSGNLVSFVRRKGNTVVYNGQNERKLAYNLTAGDQLILTEDAIHRAMATPAGTHTISVHDSSGSLLRTLPNVILLDSFAKGSLVGTHAAGTGFAVETIQGNTVLAPTPLDASQSFRGSKNLFAFIKADKTLSVANASGAVVYSVPEIKFDGGSYLYGVSSHYGWHKSLSDDYVIFNESGKVLKTINHTDLTIHLAE